MAIKKIIFVLVVVMRVYIAGAQDSPPKPKGPVAPPVTHGFTLKWSVGYTWSGAINTESIQSLGYDFKNPQVDAFVNMANSSDADGSYKQIHTTYGQGVNVSFRLGYMFNPYISFDIGATYSSSALISATQLHYLYLPDSTGALQASGGYANYKISTSSQSVTLSPAITLSYSKPKFKIYPYLRFGLSVPVWVDITHKTGIDLVNSGAITYSPYFLGTHTDVTMQTAANFTVGFNGACGAVYRPAPFMGLFFELTGQYLNLKSVVSKITQWNADGVDLASNRGTNRNHFNYGFKLPYSNLGFNIGIQVILNKSVYTDGITKKKTKKTAAPEQKKSPKPVENAK